MDYSDDQAVNAADLAEKLNSSTKKFTHLSMVHHETTAGVINPLGEICDYIEQNHPYLDLIVDSMSAFGAYEVDLSNKHSMVKYLISSANKCMEGVPGFSYVIYHKKTLDKLADIKPRSLVLDLRAQALGISFLCPRIKILF